MISIILEKSQEGIVKCNIPLAKTIEELKPARYEISIKMLRNQRTLNQNAYFHGVVIPAVAQDIGNIYPWMPTALIKRWLDETKEDIISKYLPKTVRKNKLDKRRKIVQQMRTSDCDTKEFAQMCQAILIDFPWIPEPDNWDLRSAFEHYERLYWKHF